MLRQRGPDRRVVNVVIRLLDPESSIHKYRVSWDDIVLSHREEIVEFTPSDTVPLKALLALVPRHYTVFKLTVIAPSKLLPTGAKDLPKAVVVWCLKTINCPARILFSPKTRILELECKNLPPAQVFEVKNLSHLTIHMTRQRYWPVQIALAAIDLRFVEVVARTMVIHRLELMYLHYLDQLVKCGLAASSPLTPWSIFLTKGLYDPRLLLQITAFLFPPP